MNQWVLGLLVLSLGIGGGLSLVASDAPDGLESALDEHGIHESEPLAKAPMPDYEAPLAMTPTGRKAVAGISGTLIMFGIGLLAGAVLKRLGGKHRAPPTG